MTPTSATPTKLKPGQKRVYGVRVKDAEQDHPIHKGDWWRVVTFANPDGEWGTRSWAEDALARAKKSYPHGRLIGHVFDEVVAAEPALSEIDGAFISKCLRGDIVAINKVPKKYQAQYRDTLQRAALAAYRYGKPIWVNESFRSWEQQNALYQKWLNGTGFLAAPPGSSLHEIGAALDIPNARDNSKLMKELRKVGLLDDVPSEDWHVSNRVHPLVR